MGEEGGRSRRMVRHDRKRDERSGKGEACVSRRDRGDAIALASLRACRSDEDRGGREGWTAPLGSGSIRESDAGSSRLDRLAEDSRDHLSGPC